MDIVWLSNSYLLLLFLFSKDKYIFVGVWRLYWLWFPSVWVWEVNMAKQREDATKQTFLGFEEWAQLLQEWLYIEKNNSKNVPVLIDTKCQQKTESKWEN